MGMIPDLKHRIFLVFCKYLFLLFDDITLYSILFLSLGQSFAFSWLHSSLSNPKGKKDKDSPIFIHSCVLVHSLLAEVISKEIVLLKLTDKFGF